MESAAVLGSSPRKPSGIGVWCGGAYAGDRDAALPALVCGSPSGNHWPKGEPPLVPLSPRPTLDDTPRWGAAYSGPNVCLAISFPFTPELDQNMNESCF